MKCPACSIETPGPQSCTGCGAQLAPAAAVVGPTSFTTGLLAGVAVALAVGAGFLLAGGPASAPPDPGAGTAASVLRPPPSAAPTAQPTPREEADELFNLAMSASERGDAATAARAVPAAIGAYQRLGTLDDDGTFHLASLQLAGADFAAARATSESILARSPDHLLALSVVARAAAGAGDAAAARGSYQRLLGAYDAEAVKLLPEYLDHKGVLPIYRAAAQQFVGTR